ncbi:MAG TPA: elongation factor Ts, partial [Dehalococcoidia bacterium]|nr:elongation factor Ts [Dehalococcoidia bacterium]
GMLDCKKTLDAAEQALGAGATTEQLIEHAVGDLRKKGFADAAKRAERATAEGVIQSYIHHNQRLGALVELNCESDFVARTEDFRKLTQQIALQVAGANPLYVSQEDMPAGAEGDPKDVCLLLQSFVQDESRTIQDLLSETISRTGENIRVRRFARFELGR